MSSRGVKRLFVWGISMALGFLTAWLIITVGFDLLPLVSSIQTGQARSIEEYGIMYFLVTAVPIGLVYVIWIDALMDTHILPD